MIWLLACAEPAPPPAPPPPPEDPLDLSQERAGLNVIFIDVDSLRMDHVGQGITPNIDKLAAESTVFTQASSSAPWTVPATMAIWTARWPTRHGVTNKLVPGPAGQEWPFDKLEDGIPTWPETLVREGWKAAGFTGGAGVHSRFGYSRGFETWLDDQVFAGFDHSLPPATTWVDANKDGHFFLFVHGYDVHGQHPLLDKTPREAVPDYTGKLDGGIEEQAKLREAGLAAIQKAGDPAHLEIPAEDARFLHEVYKAKVQEADARLGAFLDHLRELGLMERSIIVLFADHGEEFMEHGYLDHGATLCEHQLHVPLMIRLPGRAPGKIDTPVRTIDIFPTLFDLLGLQGPADSDGRSLVPLLAGQAAPDLPIYAETDYRLFVHHRSLRQGSRKLILDLEDGQKQLFDLGADPGELNDLAPADPKGSYELEQALLKQMNAASTDPASFLGVHQEPIKIF